MYDNSRFAKLAENANKLDSQSKSSLSKIIFGEEPNYLSYFDISVAAELFRNYYESDSGKQFKEVLKEQEKIKEEKRMFKSCKDENKTIIPYINPDHIIQLNARKLFPAVKKDFSIRYCYLTPVDDERGFISTNKESEFIMIQTDGFVYTWPRYSYSARRHHMTKLVWKIDIANPQSRKIYEGLDLNENGNNSTKAIFHFHKSHYLKLVGNLTNYIKRMYFDISMKSSEDETEMKLQLYPEDFHYLNEPDIKTPVCSIVHMDNNRYTSVSYPTKLVFYGGVLDNDDYNATTLPKSHIIFRNEVREGHPTCKHRVKYYNVITEFNNNKKIDLIGVKNFKDIRRKLKECK